MNFPRTGILKNNEKEFSPHRGTTSRPGNPNRMLMRMDDGGVGGQAETPNQPEELRSLGTLAERNYRGLTSSECTRRRSVFVHVQTDGVVYRPRP